MQRNPPYFRLLYWGATHYAELSDRASVWLFASADHLPHDSQAAFGSRRGLRHLSRLWEGVCLQLERDAAGGAGGDSCGGRAPEPVDKTVGRAISSFAARQLILR